MLSTNDEILLVTFGKDDNIDKFKCAFTFSKLERNSTN